MMKEITYEQDFVAWTFYQAQLLKNQQWNELDIEHLVEEIEVLGRREQQELRNRLGILLGHLLKWQYQPHKQGLSWVSTIKEQRRRITQLLNECPSLKSYLQTAINLGYEDAIDLAVRETKLPYHTFPSMCDYSVEEIFNDTFFPK